MKTKKTNPYKKVILSLAIAIISLLGITSQAQAEAPKLFYSDLTSGPNVGGQNNKGVFVTIWGQNFGSSRGTSTVTIGGGQADNYLEWSDTKVCFQLGNNAATGNIVVKTSAGDSNGIPFTVRPGNIYFITPAGTGDGSYTNPFSLSDFVNKMDSSSGNEDGITGYLRTGTYDGNYGYTAANHTNVSLLDNHSGTSGYPNAFVGYPNETPYITTGASVDRSNIDSAYFADRPCYYIVISKLKLNSRDGSTCAHTGWRVVGNDITGLQASGVATGVITTTGHTNALGTNIKILGNAIHGGRTGNKLDHAIYPQSGTSDLEIGWNHIYDNNFDTGPMISLNCNWAWRDNLTSTGVIIHDNYIDMANYPSRAMGVWETGPGSDITYYNNVMVCGGDVGTAPRTVYAVSGTLRYYNNTLYNCGNSNMAANFAFFEMTDHGHTYSPDSIEIKNNIILSKPESSYYIRLSNGVTATISNNLFHGIASPRGDDAYTDDATRVVSDPLFVSTSDYHLQTTSPAKNAGVTIASFNTDFDGVSRPQGASWDIGAYEYQEGGTEIRADVDQNGNINTTDALLTLRNSLGLSMSGTNWHTSATTGDVNCDSTFNSTDAMLILRHSLGLSDGAGWCGS